MNIDYVSRRIGQPALLPGEDPEKYAALFDEIWATLNPTNIFERFWVEDLTAQIWEAARYRRMMTKVLMAGEIAVARAAYERLCVCLSEEDSASLGNEEDWVSKEVLDNWDEGEAISRRADKLQRVGQMLAKAESRRNATLRAIERHREGLGPLLQEIVERVDPAETPDVANEDAAPKLAA
jgi:hypothetical protein